MLDKNKMRDLLHQKKYSEMNSIFYDSINKIIKAKLIKSNIEFNLDNNLSKNETILVKHFPRYKTLVSLINEITQTEDVDAIDMLERYMNNYKIIKERLT